MKKTIIFLLISALCLPIFTSCAASLPGIGNKTSSDSELELRPPEDSSIHTELEGIYLTLESLTDTSVSVIWHNDTDKEVTFGEWYSIELWQDGEWVNMLKDELIVPEIALLLMPHGEHSKTYSTKPFDLSKQGLYRLRCEFYPGNGERKNTWVEFDVGEKGEYTLTIANNMPLVDELKDKYESGEEITLKLYSVTEQYYRVRVNGKEINASSFDMDHTVFIFTMPARDTVVEIEEVSVDIPSAY